MGAGQAAGEERHAELGQVADIGYGNDDHLDVRVGLEDCRHGALEVRLGTRADLLECRHRVGGLHRVDEVVAADENDDEVHLAAGDLHGQARMLAGDDQVVSRRVAPGPVIFVALVAGLAATPSAEAAEIQSPSRGEDLDPVAGRAPVRGVELILVRVAIAEHPDPATPARARWGQWGEQGDQERCQADNPRRHGGNSSSSSTRAQGATWAHRAADLSIVIKQTDISIRLDGSLPGRKLWARNSVAN